MPLEPQKRDASGKFLPHEDTTRKAVQDAKTGRFISPYDVLRARVRETSPESAWKWYKTKIKELGIPDPMSLNQAIRANFGRNNATALIGGLYLFGYDAKGKDKLNYWDAAPLTLIFEFTEDGFIGINVHYMSPVWRFRFLAKLLENAAKPMSADDLLKVNWDLLGNVAKFPECRNSVKRYLANHIRTRLKRVEPEDYRLAIALPFEAFQKKTKQEVWRDTAKKIRQARSKGK